MLALLVPETFGVKVTEMVQDLEGAMLVQLEVALNDEACAPVMLILVMLKLALPVFVAVMVLGEDVEPTGRL